MLDENLKYLVATDYLNHCECTESDDNNKIIIIIAFLILPNFP